MSKDYSWEERHWPLNPELSNSISKTGLMDGCKTVGVFCFPFPLLPPSPEIESQSFKIQKCGLNVSGIFIAGRSLHG